MNDTPRCRLGARCRARLRASGDGAGFADVLDTPAQISPLASRSLLQAVAKAGDRLVAVGQRGHIVVSTDGGTTWKQSPVPVSSDLTAVYFVDDKQGWAVGHDGVILHTADGGDTWQLQLDGRKANALLVAAMERKVAAEPASEEREEAARRSEALPGAGRRQAVPRRLVRRCAAMATPSAPTT